MNNIKTDVVIIGGGLSGLTAAKVLNNADVDFQLLEASKRFGGRIDCVRGNDVEVLADLGPTWIWPEYQHDAKRWLETLGVETFAQFDEGLAVLDFDPNAPPRHQNLPGQHGIKRPVGGPQALIDCLIADLPSDRLHMEATVTSVVEDNEKFILSYGSGLTIEAAQIILAMPLRLAADTLQWNTILDEQLLATMKQARTWMAAEAKLAVVYDAPFWREKGLSGRVASRIGPMVEMHDISAKEGGSGCLFGFVGVPHETRKTHERELEEAIVAQLVRCFGEQAANYKSLTVRDWAQDAFICSQIDRETSPQHPSVLPAVLREPLGAGRFHFGVAETADRDPGLIAGAFQAGERAAKAAIKYLGEDRG